MLLYRRTRVYVVRFLACCIGYSDILSQNCSAMWERVSNFCGRKRRICSRRRSELWSRVVITLTNFDSSQNSSIYPISIHYNLLKSIIRTLTIVPLSPFIRFCFCNPTCPVFVWPHFQFISLTPLWYPWRTLLFLLCTHLYIFYIPLFISLLNLPSSLVVLHDLCDRWWRSAPRNCTRDPGISSRVMGDHFTRCCESRYCLYVLNFL